MKIQTKFRPELVASKDSKRMAISEPYLCEHEGKPVLVATDGKRLCIFPVEKSDGDTNGAVSGEALKIARSKRMDKRQSFIEVQTTEKTHVLENGWILPRENGYVFPNWKTVLPEKPITRKVCLNAKLLWEMCQAMGCDCIVIELSESDTDPIRVRPQGAASGERGVLMPLRYE